MNAYRLRLLTRGDAAALLRLFSQPAVGEYMDIPVLGSETEALEIIRWTEEVRAAETGMRFAIRTTDDSPPLQPLQS